MNKMSDKAVDLIVGLAAVVGVITILLFAIGTIGTLIFG